MGPDQKGVPSFVSCIGTVKSARPAILLLTQTHQILGKRVKKLPDLVVVLGLELLPGPSNALVESKRLVVDEVGADLQKLSSLARGLGRLDKVGLREVRVDDLGGLLEELLESLLAPLRR